jgi:hypothetical protein
MDTGNNNLGDTNLGTSIRQFSSHTIEVSDSILDNIERDVTRRTMEARQALVRKNNPESMIKEDPHRRVSC